MREAKVRSRKRTDDIKKGRAKAMMEAWWKPVFGGLRGRACVNRRKAEKRADGGYLELGGAGCGAARIGRQSGARHARIEIPGLVC
jgi:hypothetical protein